MTKQTNVFEFIGSNDDPLYNRIEKMKEGQEIEVGKYKVRKSEKFYEIENDDIHEGFKTINKCYSFICSNLDR